MLKLSEIELKIKVDNFIWNYKVGDNIKHNIEDIIILYEYKNNSSSVRNGKIFNKYISIIYVSLIEAMLYDFVVRLSEATTEFPKDIQYEKKLNIKNYLSKQKVSYKSNNRERATLLRVRNYSLAQIIKFLQDFELLEKANHNVYLDLNKIAIFRNRIHIYNWYGNFEKDERNLYTDTRLLSVEKYFLYVLNTLESRYSRPKW